MSWIVPAKLFSEENLGYVLQVKQYDTCVVQVIYKCSDCIEEFSVSTLSFTVHFLALKIMTSRYSLTVLI